MFYTSPHRLALAPVATSITAAFGTGLSLDTTFATTRGLRPLGKLRIGDYICAADGTPTEVLALGPVLDDLPCFEMRFSDGASVVCAAQQQWHTAAIHSGNPRGRPTAGKAHATQNTVAARPTADIAATLSITKGDRRWNHRLDVAPALQTPDDPDLIVPPYLLGVWLGDGDTARPYLTICATDTEILDRIAREGTPWHEIKDKVPSRISASLTTPGSRRGTVLNRLREIAVIGDKHIPTEYLMAGTAQRLALLQGLMDTDGTINPSGHCELPFTRKRLADHAIALIRGLGYKATMSVKPAFVYTCADGSTRDNAELYRIYFQARADMMPFSLSRKAARVRQSSATRPLSASRQIIACDRIASVPVRSIAIAHPRGVYLATECLLPCDQALSPQAAGVLRALTGHNDAS